MMSRFSSVVRVKSLKTGMFCGPVTIAAYMCSALVLVRAGAYLPSVRAPPAAATLWHIAQLMRKSSAPAETSPSPSSTWASGNDGPGDTDWVKAASASICSCVNCTGFCGAWGPCICSGMRPVETWNSTESSPTP